MQIIITSDEHKANLEKLWDYIKDNKAHPLRWGDVELGNFTLKKLCEGPGVCGAIFVNVDFLKKR